MLPHSTRGFYGRTDAILILKPLGLCATLDAMTVVVAKFIGLWFNSPATLYKIATWLWVMPA